MPFMEMTNLYNQWYFGANVWGNGGVANPNGFLPAQYDMRSFYCPSRRNTLRPGQDTQSANGPMFPCGVNGSQGGGTDYGGCAGRVPGWDPGNTHAFLEAFPSSGSDYTNLYIPAPFYNATTTVSDAQHTILDNSASRRQGIFFQPNGGTNPASIRDGLFEHNYDWRVAADIAGDQHDRHPVGRWSEPRWLGCRRRCHFVQHGGSNPPGNTSSTPPTGPLLNNLDFRSPGSDHIAGAHFGFADGSVRLITNSVDKNIFALLGSMADTIPVQPPD